MCDKVWWGSSTTDRRDLNVFISGETPPTFDTIRGGRRFSSFVDMTAPPPDLLGVVGSWRVLEGLTSSDHNRIYFQVRLQISESIQVKGTTRILNT